MALTDKLTAIANKIRTLDGTTAEKTLDEMATSVDEANAEVTTQAAKIAELSTILDGKAGGSGGNSNAGEWINVKELPTTYDVAGSVVNEYYMEVESAVSAVLVVAKFLSGSYINVFAVAGRNTDGDFISVTTSDVVTINQAGENILGIITSVYMENIYALPIYEYSGT